MEMEEGASEMPVLANVGSMVGVFDIGRIHHEQAIGEVSYNAHDLRYIRIRIRTVYGPVYSGEL